MSNHKPSEVGDKLTNPFPSFIGRTVHDLEGINDLTYNTIMDVMTDPCWVKINLS